MFLGDGLLSNSLVVFSNDGWNRARMLVNGLTGIQGPLTQLIRSVERSPHEFDSTTRQMLRPILSASRYRSVVFYALITIYPEDFDETSSVEFSQLLVTLTPRDHQCIAATTIAFNLLKKITHFEQIIPIDTDFQEIGEAGMLLGRHVAKIGPGLGLLLGILRPLGFGMLSSHNNTKFQTYRKHLRQQGILYDVAKEREIFGFAHPELAALLLMRLGFSKKLCLNLYLAIDTTVTKDLSTEVLELRAAYEVITAIVKGPELIESHEPYRARLGESYQRAFKDLVAREQKVKYAWMQRDGTKLKKRNAPDLFKDERETQQSQAPRVSIPDSILDQFSIEDIDSFRQMVCDLLDPNVRTSATSLS